MRGRVSWIAAAGVAGIVVVSPLRVQAQDLAAPKCVGGPPGSAALIAQDACQQAYDVYQLIAPQLGLALAGGNATAGTGSVLGGLGHFSVGIRANVFDGLFPNTDNGGFPVSTSGAQRRTLPTKGQWFGAPTADAAIGLYKGVPLALTNVLGVDALVSAEYVPTIKNNGGDFTLDPSSNFRFGYGVRIGLLSESIAFPGVSFTWIERDLPTINIGINGSSVGASGSTIDISNMDVKTRAWRIAASKSLIAFSVAAGIGQDNYKQSATLTGTVNQLGISSPPLAAGQTLSRTNLFGDFSINLPLFKIVFEVGDALGGSVATFNSFAGGRADRSQVYGSFGLRLSR
ncbi:MAG TPA: hypothetical protein VGH04_08235 [Gemmatimonadaceae bacterium]